MLKLSTICGIALSLFILCFCSVTPVAALDVVATTSVLWDPAQAIGGEHVEVIYVADPSICPHMQGDVIDARIQMNRDFIASADLFLAYDSSMDKAIVMPAIQDFMQANGYGTVTWTVPAAADWNTPEKAKVLAEDIRDILVAADPTNTTSYEARYNAYCDTIDAADITGGDRARVEGQDVVVMVWQREAAEAWLGLNVVSIFGPEFYMGGQFTPAKIVDDINANPEKYRNVKYVIENMQSGELAKGIEEALHDRGIAADRVIFTNFPKSLPGVESIPGVLEHNKEIVMASPNTGGGDREDSPASLATSLSAGEETEFSFENGVLSRIVLVPEEDMASVVMNVQVFAYLPGGTTAPENATYHYLDISPTPALSGGCNATIEFTVGNSWMTAQGAGPLDIALLHWHNGAWERLTTEYLGTDDDGTHHYRAFCTGFSLFAITYAAGAAVAAEIETTQQTVTPTTDATETVNVAKTTTATSYTPAATPAKTGAEATTPQPAPLPIALALGALVLAAGLKWH
ncbi:metal ABC transporter solute-binding protein, Zn/Mn family [Methanofollis tationis]|uniref:PGF-pre-PGF domain-containing protein n=1 Tax=Methanofollis tationis TaxID=81417 RepID=A0A7K4HPL7_9EURY|nr:PGF-pre-PGF domain-containing protein [Methanofollis tationis]NVO67007.1 PGF-pre-PGF domain-containing protein [Methanofollis tationis]